MPSLAQRAPFAVLVALFALAVAPGHSHAGDDGLVVSATATHEVRPADRAVVVAGGRGRMRVAIVGGLIPALDAAAMAALVIRRRQISLAG